MKKSIRLLIIAVVVFGFYSMLSANDGVVTSAEARLKSYEKHLEMKGSSLFKNLKWKSIGPYFMGGRVTDIEGYGNDPYKFLLASASGGLWLTTNNATTWTPIFDHESSITIGDIAVSQTDPDLIWVGSGEENSSRSSYAGSGVFKSTDGGKSWTNMGLAETQHIGHVLIDPSDNNVVYVAALGHLYTDNEERGLYKTSDGGKTWEKVLYISPKTGIVDVVMHPKNRNVLYAAAWQRERKAWNFVEGGPESAIYKSSDAGKTWKKAVNGFPQTKHTGRIGLAVSPSSPDVVYAYLDNQEPKPAKKDAKKGNDANTNLFNTNIKGAEVYRSNDSGESWAKTHDHYLDGIVFTYGYYFGVVRVAPDNPDVVYIQGVPLMKSSDGGKTFKNISSQGGIYGVGGVHADMQALWIDPKNPKRLLLGNDGGFNISYDEGGSWQKINNIPLAQCYTINYDNQKPYRVYTGLQDNGVNVGPSNFSRKQRKDSWQMILGGDGAFVQAQTNDPNTVFAEFQFGYLFRINIKTQYPKSIRPKPKDKKSPYRFNWLSPFFVSPHNPLTLYIGANKVLKSVDRGEHWVEVSPDLTLQKNTDGDVPYATIVSLDESPLSPGMLYAGTDDGNLWLKKGDLSQWQKINNGLPVKWVTRVVASKFKKERVYVTLTGYRDDDFQTYVYRSDDFGGTWTSIKANLPEEPVNVIREDTENQDILYLGTDLGIYVSLDRGKSWHSLKNNLPTNAVYDLRVHPREKELIIGTHGRGVFILPVADLQKMTAKMLETPLHIFKEPKVEWSFSFMGPPSPPKVHFSFYSNSADDVQWSIADAAGNPVYATKEKAEKGFNFFSWNTKDRKKSKKEKKKKRKKKAMKPKPQKVKKGDYTLIIKKGKSQAKQTFKITK
ncbi:MAG: glycosyl hydrolase [bacterium]|nr:glycosyl hydrolase [bacterium]